jgi:hypothetical protein
VVRLSNHGICSHNSLATLRFLFLATLRLVSTKVGSNCFLIVACHSVLRSFHEDMQTLGFGGDLQIPSRSSESLFNISNISSIFSSSQPIFSLDLADQLPFSLTVLNLSLPHLHLSVVHIMFPHIFHHVLHSFHFSVHQLT